MTEDKPTRRKKGTGGLYQRASDGMWCAAVELPSDGTGKRRRKVIARAKKSDAEKARRDAVRDLQKQGDLTTAAPTIAQWCDTWWDRYALKNLKVTSLPSYRSPIEQYIKPAIGRIRLDRLEVTHVYRLHEYVQDTKGLSATTAHGAHRVLSAILSDAEKERLLLRNVAKIANKPRVRKEAKKYLDNAQARDLLLAVKDVPLERAMWTTAFLAGLRPSERLGLTRDMVDLDNGVLTVAWQQRRLAYDHGCLASGKPTCGRKRGGNCPKRTVRIREDEEARHVAGPYWLLRPKSSTSWRRFPMPALLTETLRDYIENHPPGLEGLLFTRPDGSPIDHADDSDLWRERLEAEGLPRVTGHSTRHSCNTILTELGVPVDVRQKILGHASAAVNEAVYTHTSDSRVADATALLSNAFR